MNKRLTDAEARMVMLAAGLDPLETYKRSSAPWKCKCLECGREVAPTYDNVKQRKRGCGYCSGKKVDKEEAIAAMRAAGLEPLETFRRSNYPWKCKCSKCGREVTPAYNTIKRGNGGCGYCAEVKVDEEEAVATMRAAGLEPLEPFKRSGVPWKCKCLECGREVAPCYDSIKQGNGGCGYCAGLKVDEEEVVAAMHAAGLQPLEPYKNNRVPWKCKCLICGREVTPRYSTIKAGNGGCGYCAGVKVDEEEVVAAMLAASLEPLEPFKRSIDPWKCKCLKCGREVTPAYNTIKRGNGGCGYCAGNKVDVGEVVAAMHDADLEPLEPYRSANKPWKCKCLKCGRSVAPRWASIQSGGGGCIYCAGVKVDEEEAVATMRAAGLEPLEPFNRSVDPWKCMCLKCGREVNPQYHSIDQGYGGCGYCAGVKVDEEEAVATMRAAGFNPLEPYKGGHHAWKCECLKCGRTVTPQYSNIKTGQSGCIYCVGHKVDEAEVVAAMRVAGLEPLESYKNAHEPWKCKCLECGQIVTPSWTSIKQGRGGCRSCAEYGFDPSQPSVVYFIEHSKHRALKIGVTGVARKHNRLSIHTGHGWNTIQTWIFNDGSQALEIEEKVLNYWRDDLGAPMFLRESDMPQGGWTETVDSIAVDVEATIALIEYLMKCPDR